MADAVADSTVDPRSASSAELLFVGNATVLIRYGALSLLTDPNFLHRGQRAYLGYGLTSRRLTEPALPPPAALRDLDTVILSHLHGDHWDRVARRTLERSVPILTTPRAGCARCTASVTRPACRSGKAAPSNELGFRPRSRPCLAATPRVRRGCCYRL